MDRISTDAGISLSASASQAASKLLFRAHGWREIDGLPDGTGYKRHRERRNGFFQSVLQDEVGKRAFSAVIPMTQQDAMETTQEPHWQTNRTSDCIPAGLMFTDVRTQAGELVALGAYEMSENAVAVHIVYMESQAQSNPTLCKSPRYHGIGWVLIAYGIKLSVDAGFKGNVTLVAKTPGTGKAL